MGAERSEDLSEHALGVRQHVVVPEAKHAPAEPCKIEVARLVRCGVSMLPAVDLHNHSRFDTSKIGDVGRDRVLASEAPAREPVISETSPQASLCIRHFPSESAGTMLCASR